MSNWWPKLVKLRLALLLPLILLLISCTHANNANPLPNSNANLAQASDLNVELGLNYLHQGMHARAKQKLLYAIKLNPNNANAHSALGYFWSQVGELTEADNAYRRALDLAANGENYNAYANFLCHQQRFELAEHYFNKAIQDKKYANTVIIYENAGICAWRHQRAQLAQQYLTAAIEHGSQRSDIIELLQQLKSSNSDKN